VQQGTSNPLTATSQTPVDSSGTPVVTTSGRTPDTILAGIAVPVGAIAMAPAEPIEEIRVLQEFGRAESFYQTLFYRDIGLGADLLSLEQFRESRDTSDDMPVPYLTVREVDQAPPANQIADLAAVAAQSGEQVARDRARARPPVAPDRLRSTAVFRYQDVVDMETRDGVIIPISIQGIDTTTRTRLLQAIAAVRNRSQTEDDIRLLQEATQTDIQSLLPLPEGENQALQASVASVQLPEAQRQQLQQLLQETEITLRTDGAQINVRGDVHIVPRPGAEALFDSFRAAMLYNSRPICTLDEYLMFLGEDGLAEGETHPQASNLYANVDPKPAKYYKRLRRLRPGPPAVRPGLNLTNTESVSDAPAGTAAVTATTAEGEVQTGAAAAPALSQELVEALVQPLTSGLLPAQASAITTGLSDLPGRATTETFTRFSAEAAALRRALRNGLDMTPERYVAELTQLLTRAANNAIPAPTAAATTATGTAEPNTAPGGGTYPVAGIPADFPDTRANWDILLEQYNYNVLQRKPPRL